MATKRKTKKTPIARAVNAKAAIDRERDLLEQTVGITTKLVMDKGTEGTPDVALIYRNLGGKTKFTTQLLAEVFGSPSTNRKGSYSLTPGVVPDFEKLTQALVSTSRRLAAEGVAGVSKLNPEVLELPVGRRVPGSVWTLPLSSPVTPGVKELEISVTVVLSCSGRGGGETSGSW